MLLSNPVNLNIFRRRTGDTLIFRNVELRQVIISLYNWRTQGYISNEDAKDIIRILDQLAVETDNVEAMEEIDKGLFEVDKIIKANTKS